MFFANEVDPAIYEQDMRYDNNGYQNILLITNVRKKDLQFNNMRLNVFIHYFSNSCDVEIRYESQNPIVNQLVSVRNDQVVQGFLDELEKEVSG